MDAATLEVQVQHVVRQVQAAASNTVLISHVLLLLDPRRGPFPREYCCGSWDDLVTSAQRLVDEAVVDGVVVAASSDQDADSAARVRSVCARWFGDTGETESHTESGVPITNSLEGFEAASALHAGAACVVLHLDVDMLIHVPTAGVGSLGALVRALVADPSAVTLALPVLSRCATPMSAYNSEGRPWRVEVRCGLFHMPRLLALRPFCGRGSESNLCVGWYRHLDASIARARGSVSSLRGGGGPACLAVVHPPNVWKGDSGRRLGWLMDAVEVGRFPAEQHDVMDAVGNGSITGWLPHTSSNVVFAIPGRNVEYGRVARCLASLAGQVVPVGFQWHAVVVDDASQSRDVALFLRAVASHPLVAGRVSVLRPAVRQSGLGNIDTIVRHTATARDAVIVTVDLDDCLLGSSVLRVLLNEYSRGADVVLAANIRPDKPSRAASAPRVAFQDCRRVRGVGNVWRHLRSFKAALYRSVPQSELRDNDGVSWLEPHDDWAYMVPIVELSHSPRAIDDCLYLYEPRTTRRQADRDRVATIITTRPSLRRRRRTVAVVGDADAAADGETARAAYRLGQRLVSAGYVVVVGGLKGVMSAAARGAQAASRHELGTAGAQSLVVGIVPGDDAASANPWCDMVVATGLGHARNAVVAHSDAVVAVGGGAGTLSEVALAWSLKRLVIALVPPDAGATGSSTAARLAGVALDRRRKDLVHYARTEDDVLELLHRHLEDSVSASENRAGINPPSRL
jgi:uncharacterized protein (TIGR00725 family)